MPRRIPEVGTSQNHIQHFILNQILYSQKVITFFDAPLHFVENSEHFLDEHFICEYERKACLINISRKNMVLVYSYICIFNLC